LRLLVGATVPSRNGQYLALSWPMVRLVVREQSVALEFRADCTRRLAHIISGGGSGSKTDGLLWWSATATDISRVTVAPRSCLITTTRGDCCFGIPRYLGPANEKWQRIQAELDRLRLNLEYSSSNFWKRNEMKSGK
jgi:hypothetical protein